MIRHGGACYSASIFTSSGDKARSNRAISSSRPSQLESLSLRPPKKKSTKFAHRLPWIAELMSHIHLSVQEDHHSLSSARECEVIPRPTLDRRSTDGGFSVGLLIDQLAALGPPYRRGRCGRCHVLSLDVVLARTSNQSCPALRQAFRSRTRAKPNTPRRSSGSSRPHPTTPRNVPRDSSRRRDKTSLIEDHRERRRLPARKSRRDSGPNCLLPLAGNAHPSANTRRGFRLRIFLDARTATLPINAAAFAGYLFQKR